MLHVVSTALLLALASCYAAADGDESSECPNWYHASFSWISLGSRPPPLQEKKRASEGGLVIEGELRSDTDFLIQAR